MARVEAVSKPTSDKKGPIIAFAPVANMRARCEAGLAAEELAIPILLRSMLLAATWLSFSIAAEAAAPVADRALTAALNDSVVRVLQAKDFMELRRGTIADAELLDRCTLRLKLRRESQLETISSTKLRFVQGDGVSVDIASSIGEPREYIIQVGEKRYARVVELLTSRATSCGAKLVGPPPIVVTGI